MIINDLRGRVTRPRGNCNRELYFPVMGSYPMDNCTCDANKHTNLCQFLPRSSDCAGCPSYPLPRWFSRLIGLSPDVLCQRVPDFLIAVARPLSLDRPNHLVHLLRVAHTPLGDQRGPERPVSAGVPGVRSYVGLTGGFRNGLSLGFDYDQPRPF